MSLLSESRMIICKSCPRLSSMNVCKECGCAMVFKTRMASAKCPLGKWGPQ